MQKYTFGLLSLVALVGVLAVANLSEMKSYGLACGVPAVGAQPADWLPLPASGVDRAMVLCLALAAALSLFSASVAPPRRAFLTAWLLLVFAVLFGMLPVFARAVSPRESLLSWDFILVVGAVAAGLVVSYRETPSDLKQLVRQLGEGAAVDRRRLVLLACAIGASAIVAAAFVLVVRTKVQLTRSEAITSLRHTLAATRVMSLMPPSGVQIVVFMDYQCPYCRITHGAIGEALRRLGSKAAAVEVRYKDFPLDASCNQMMSATLHKEACAAAYAVRVAERYGHRGSFEGCGSHREHVRGISATAA